MQEIKILLVEDEKKLSKLLQTQLERAGFQVTVAADGVFADEALAAGTFHMVILDLNLPRKSGMEVLRTLRQAKSRIPVLILSARDSRADLIEGLQQGADDYLVKPFDSGELVARIYAILRRSGMESMGTLQVGDLTVDLYNRTASRANKKLELSNKEFTLLEYFIKNKNQILSRRRILENVWGYTFDTGTNIVDVYVSYLREAVDKGQEKKLIQTIHGQGFILMGD